MKLLEPLKLVMRRHWPLFLILLLLICSASWVFPSFPAWILALPLGALFLMCCRWMKLLALVLCLSIATPQKSESAAPAAGVIVGVSVVVVAGVVIIVIVRFCQKHFQSVPPTNAPPSVDEFAENWTGTCGSCVTLGDVSLLPQPTHVRIEVDEHKHARFSVIPPSELVGITEFRNELSPWGLTASGSKIGESWDFGPGWMHYRPHDAQTRTLTLEQSNDLVHWENVIEAEIPVGMKVEIRDVSFEGSSYYRIH
jgi:hypothetical protein